MQDRIRINNVDIFQPDRGLKNAFETTYTEDSTRTQDGIGHFTPMFTVEQFNYTATNIPADKVSEILQMIVGKNFMLHYFSPYYGRWRTDEFYVGKGDLTIGTLVDSEEIMDVLSFNMQGVNPV